MRNQQPDGRWLYQYDRATGEVPDAYNIVRHAGATMGLYQAATAGIDGALESADRGVAWARARLLDHDGWTALADERTAPVGATALLTAGLVERRLLTGDDRDDALLRSLGGFLASMTRPDGAVVAQFDLASMTPVADSRSKYYTGEAYWALGRLHRLFPDDGFGEVADRIGDYLATRRDDVEGIWPPVPDHWVAYGLAETVQFRERDHERPLTDAELAYARTQAGSFGAQVRWVSQQAGPWGAAVRGTRVPRGRVRRRRRGADRAVARRRRRRPPRRRPRPARRTAPSASPAWRSTSRTVTGSGPGATAPGSSTTSRAWTTSSTRSRPSCAPRRSSTRRRRRATRHRWPGCGH